VSSFFGVRGKGEQKGTDGREGVARAGFLGTKNDLPKKYWQSRPKRGKKKGGERGGGGPCGWSISLKSGQRGEDFKIKEKAKHCPQKVGDC